MIREYYFYYLICVMHWLDFTFNYFLRLPSNVEPAVAIKPETSVLEPAAPEPSAPPEEPEQPPALPTEKVTTDDETKEAEGIDEGAISDMSASFMAKARISTEQEAKAALAERRRLIREEAERQAELERQRIEEEARKEMERQQKEEEQLRLLIEQQRAAEQERLEEVGVKSVSGQTVTFY